MNQLTNIENAKNLSGDEKDTLESLLKVFRSVSARNSKKTKYYEGDVTPSSIGLDIIPKNVNIVEHCDWPRKAVTAVSERSRFDGFVFGSDYKDEGLANAVADNAFKNAFNLHIPSELTHGCMFGTVGKFGDHVQMRMHTAETATGTWDMGAGRLAAGFCIADCKRTSWSKSKPVPVQVNMHLPNEVVIIRRTSATDWIAEKKDTPLDRPMMEVFAFRASGIKPFGESRITDTVMSITDDVIRTLQYMAISSAFFAVPQKYLLGLTDAQFDQMKESKWATYIGNILLATRDQDGNIPTFGQLAPQSPQPFIDQLRTYAMMFSGATGVPLNSLGIVQDNPSSSQAIEASREDIIVAADDLIASNREGLRNMALMAMAVSDNTTIERLSDNQKTVTAHFSDPSIPSIVGLADALVKVAGVAPWLSESEVFLEYLGFGEDDRKRLLSDKAKSQAQNLLAAALSEGNKAAGQTEATETTPPNSEQTMKQLNGAQTQSLIAIMGQFGGGEITEGQATKLISTAIGMSTEEARKILLGID